MSENREKEPKNLSSELDRTRKELAILYDISNAMRTTLDLEHILYIILTGVTSHAGLGFNRAILFLINPRERCLEPRMAIGPESLEDAQRIWSYISGSQQRLDDLIKTEKLDENVGQKTLFDSVKDLKVPLGKSKDNILLTAYLDGSPVLIDQDKMSLYANDPLVHVFQTKELVVMPLKVKDQVNGLIVADNLYTQKPIADDDLKIFTMLANQAGLAIENSRLYELTKYKSHTDALTGLWNHGYFQDKLTEEIDQARKDSQMLGLMMVDIDNFKSLNDSYGHQNGDTILKEIANILKESSRSIDHVCRYGGEEFSIILTQSGHEQSYTVAERIRTKVKSFPFPAGNSEEPLKVTVSIGLAVMNGTDIRSKETFIAEADKAMYEAKFGGKDQTVRADLGNS